MPSQPSSSISCAWNTASAIVVAATPATTGTRPLAALTTTSTMRRRWAQRRYANSPVDPKAANPCTPAAIRSLHRRFRTSSTTSPEGKTGETRCGKTPWNAASGINKHNHRIKAPIVTGGAFPRKVGGENRTVTAGRRPWWPRMAGLQPLSTRAFGPRLRRLTALTALATRPLIATKMSTARCGQSFCKCHAEKFRSAIFARILTAVHTYSNIQLFGLQTYCKEQKSLLLRTRCETIESE